MSREGRKRHGEIQHRRDEIRHHRFIMLPGMHNDTTYALNSYN
jgi:hypothetical protein